MWFLQQAIGALKYSMELILLASHTGDSNDSF